MKLVDFLIDQYERSSKWNHDLEGNSSLRVEDKHYMLIGKEAFLHQAKELESYHLLTIKWIKGYYNADIEKLMYPLKSMDEFYRLAERKPKYKVVQEQKQAALEFIQAIKTPWMKNYVDKEILTRLEKGKPEENFEKVQLLYQCLVALDSLEGPVFKRVFSKRFFNNSKIFKNQLQSIVIRLAKTYLDTIDEDMEDSDVLAQLYIEEYSQELHLKGSLLLKVDGIIIDTGDYHYGMVLNTQTLKNAEILGNQRIRRILTIENKANFVAEAYEEGTLLLYSHGYFSPLEREFLNRLREKLKGQSVSYLHSGDMDYGGVCIFQYIKNRIFPEVKPYKMDVRTFNQYIAYAEPIEESKLEKLRKKQEPMLQELIECILNNKLVLEQEAYVNL